MSEPQTSNIGLIVPNTGDLVGTWGSAAINPDLQAIDGYQGGVVAVALSGNVVLTSPAGFTATPTAGPTQSQNGLIRLSGALSSNITVTFPLPGYYIVENLCTNIGTYYVQLLSSGAGNAIGAIPGKKCHVFNDGTNMDYVNLPDPGTAYDLHGWTTYPPWMTACTISPYLIKDGTQYATSTYPYLFANIGYTFGGSGSNFNVPDELARMRVPFDTKSTGRMTSPVSATTMNSSGGEQAHTLITGEMPTHNHGVTDPGHLHSFVWRNESAASGAGVAADLTGSSSQNNTETATTGISIQNAGSSDAHNNVQPSITSFLALIKT